MVFIVLLLALCVLVPLICISLEEMDRRSQQKTARLKYPYQTLPLGTCKKLVDTLGPSAFHTKRYWISYVAQNGSEVMIDMNFVSAYLFRHYLKKKMESVHETDAITRDAERRLCELMAKTDREILATLKLQEKIARDLAAPSEFQKDHVKQNIEIML